MKLTKISTHLTWSSGMTKVKYLMSKGLNATMHKVWYGYIVYLYPAEVTIAEMNYWKKKAELTTKLLRDYIRIYVVDDNYDPEKDTDRILNEKLKELEKCTL